MIPCVRFVPWYRCHFIVQLLHLRTVCDGTLVVDDVNGQKVSRLLLYDMVVLSGKVLAGADLAKRNGLIMVRLNLLVCKVTVALRVLFTIVLRAWPNNTALILRAFARVERDSSSISRAAEDRTAQDTALVAAAKVVRRIANGRRSRVRTATCSARRALRCGVARLRAECGMALHRWFEIPVSSLQ